MKLPRISISFSSEDHQERPLDSPIPHPSPGTEMVPEEVGGLSSRAAAIRAVLESSALPSDDLLAAREHVRSIQYAWKEFQSNLEQDRLLLQMARRVELLEHLHDLEHRQLAAVGRLRSGMGQSDMGEVQS